MVVGVGTMTDGEGSDSLLLESQQAIAGGRGRSMRASGDAARRRDAKLIKLAKNRSLPTLQ